MKMLAVFRSMRSIMMIHVKCFSGYRGEETPREIVLDKRAIGVQEILDRWLAPDHRYFKILGDDDAIYIVRQETDSWTWELTFYTDKASPVFPTNIAVKQNPWTHSS